MPRSLVFSGRRTAFKFHQRRVEPFPFGYQALMLLVKRVHTRSRPFQFGICSGISPRNVAPGAFEFDFGTAARALVFQLHLIVPNHAFDQLVSRQHPLPGAIQLGGFLGCYLWSASTGAHCFGFRSTFRTNEEIFRQNCYGIRTARPWMRP